MPAQKVWLAHVPGRMRGKRNEERGEKETAGEGRTYAQADGDALGILLRDLLGVVQGLIDEGQMANVLGEVVSRAQQGNLDVVGVAVVQRLGLQHGAEHGAVGGLGRAWQVGIEAGVEGLGGLLGVGIAGRVVLIPLQRPREHAAPLAEL